MVLKKILEFQNLISAMLWNSSQIIKSNTNFSSISEFHVILQSSSLTISSIIFSMSSLSEQFILPDTENLILPVEVK